MQRHPACLFLLVALSTTLQPCSLPCNTWSLGVKAANPSIWFTSCSQTPSQKWREGETGKGRNLSVLNKALRGAARSSSPLQSFITLCQTHSHRRAHQRLKERKQYASKTKKKLHSSYTRVHARYGWYKTWRPSPNLLLIESIEFGDTVRCETPGGLCTGKMKFCPLFQREIRFFPKEFPRNRYNTLEIAELQLCA